MKQDIPRLIRESGMTFHLGLPHQKVVEQLERLVTLAIAEEREACAKVCEHDVGMLGRGALGEFWADKCATSIRARGQS